MIEDIEPLVGEFDRDIEYVLPDVCVTDDELAAALAPKADKTDIPTKASQLENDCDYTTNLYVNAKFEEAIKAGFKTEVVETLPTENISHQIIYLVPNEEAAEQNIHDEYVYTANNEWEKIGSTNIAVDKSYQLLYINDRADTNEFAKISEFITNLYKNNLSGLVRFGTSNNNVSYGFKDPFYEIKPFTTQATTIYAYAMVGGLYQQHAIYASFEGTWSDGVFTLTKIGNALGKNSSGPLAANNTNSFTPTGDYNPATKKYVDDAVANVGSDGTTITRIHIKSTGDSGTVKDSETLEQVSKMINDAKAGKLPICNFYIDDPWNGQYFKDTLATAYNNPDYNKENANNVIYYYRQVTPLRELRAARFLIYGNWVNGVFEATSISYNIDRSVGKSDFDAYYALTLDNKLAYTPTGDYNPATKKYVDDSLANIDVSSIDRLELASTSISSDKLAEIQAIVSKHFQDKSSILLELKVGTNNSCLLFGQTAAVFSDNGNAFYFEPLQPIAQDALHYSASLYDMVIYCALNDDGTDCIVSRAECRQRSRKQFLAKDNTNNFEPTGDYHPATKKYVDDSVASICVRDDYEIVPIDCGNYSADSPIKARALQNASYLINQLYQDYILPSTDENKRKKTYMAMATYHNQYYTCCSIIGKLTTSLSKKPTSITFLNAPTITAHGTGSNDFNSGNQLNIAGTWDGEVFTATNVSLSGYGSYSFLSTTANYAYTPSSDYNPATKKYVDILTQYDWNTYGVTAFKLYTTYEAGTVVFYNNDSKYYRCLTQHYASSFTKSNWEELTEEEVNEFKRVDKQYVDDAVANAGGGVPTYCLYQSGTNVLEESGRDINEVMLEIHALKEQNKPFDIIFTKNTARMRLSSVEYPAAFKVDRYYFIDTESRSVSGTYLKRDRRAVYYINVTFNDDYSNVSAIGVYERDLYSVEKQQDVLTTANTIEFTPTGDYNPATKKYVDDNTIPTITTKEELSDLINKTKWERNGSYYTDLMFRYKSSAADVPSGIFRFYNFSLDSISNRLIGGEMQVSQQGEYLFCRSEHLKINGNTTDGVTTITTLTYSSGSPTLLTSTQIDRNIDSKINNALGDINTILATLTTVEEGE